MMDLAAELRDISQLIGSAAFIDAVRREVRRAVGSTAMVMDGEHHEKGSSYQVVVKLASGENIEVISRRIRGAFPDMDVENLADGVIGIKISRRGRHAAM